MKPRPSARPPTKQKFQKSANGSKHQRGGGLVLDCQYELNLKDHRYRADLLYEVRKFVAEFNGDEKVEEDIVDTSEKNM